jgi:hypothetical protein
MSQPRESSKQSREKLKDLRAQKTLLVDVPGPKGMNKKSAFWLASSTGEFFVSRVKRNAPNLIKWERFAGPRWTAEGYDFLNSPLVSKGRFSHSGRLLALSGHGSNGWQIDVLDWHKREKICTRPINGIYCAHAFSTDEDWLFVASREEAGSVLWALPLRAGLDEKKFPLGKSDCWDIQPHPAGRWLALGVYTRLGILDLQKDGALQLFNVGGSIDFGPSLLSRLESPQVKEQLQKWDKELPAATSADLRKIYEAQKLAAQQAIPASMERVAALDFTPDGQWLVCATDAGVRVFAWSKLLQFEGGNVEWSFAAEAEDPIRLSSKDVFNTRNVNSIAYDAKLQRVLFGGAEGKLKYLELSTNRVGEFPVVSEGMPITQLHLSADSGVLAMTKCEIHRGNDGKSKFQIWDYAAINETALQSQRI